MHGLVNFIAFMEWIAPRFYDFLSRLSNFCHISKSSFHLSHYSCIRFIFISYMPCCRYSHCWWTFCIEYCLDPSNTCIKPCPLPIRFATTSEPSSFSVACILILPLPFPTIANRKNDCTLPTWCIMCKVNYMSAIESIGPLNKSTSSPSILCMSTRVHIAATRNRTVIRTSVVWRVAGRRFHNFNYYKVLSFKISLITQS